ncbi:MAG: AAA family ATPase [Bacteroidales bacterium]|nr:AAA family ATPase [Bacteroidales bacterium]
MRRGDVLYSKFLSSMGVLPTPDQDELLHNLADFMVGDDSDIFVVNGYAGTGKTTTIAAVTDTLHLMDIPVVLLAPTGRAAKVLSSYTHLPAYTIHKHIYRQKSVGGDGFGEFRLFPNRAKDTLFVVDEVSLIGIDSDSQRGGTAFGSGNLLEDLINFVRNGADCKLVLVGDSAQLPPVGLECSPALSKEYMEGYGGVEYGTLSTVVRQKEETGILSNATMIREMIEESDFGAYGGGQTYDGIQMDVDGYEDIERISGGELIEKLQDAYGTYGDDEVIVLCRSNKRALRYNAGIRSTVQFVEDQLVRGDKLMIVKNCYQFVEEVEGMDYIANGDMATLIGGPKHFEERYGLHFADVTLSFPDYNDQEIDVKVIMDALQSDSASLSYEQQNALYQGVLQDYSDLSSKKKRYDAIKNDKYYNALQLKYANAITCHKSQGGQWKCVFVDNPLWQEEITVDDLKWLYTALTRAVEKVYLVNFKDEYFF